MLYLVVASSLKKISNQLLMELLITWLVNAVAVIITAYVLPRVEVKNFWAALVVALVLGIINYTLKPILLVLTLPVNILTLGLFTLVINAIIILLVDKLLTGFKVGGFWMALIFSIVLGLVNGVLTWIIPG